MASVMKQTLHRRVVCQGVIQKKYWLQCSSKSQSQLKNAETRQFSSEEGAGWGENRENIKQLKQELSGNYKSPWKLRKETIEGNMSGLSQVPKDTDILIVGGGAIGSSVAFWLKHQNPQSLNITVVERDPVYTRASSMLSCGGIRCQFSVPENVQLSLFSSEFLRNIKQNLSVLDESLPDVQFHDEGYLFLAPPRGAQLLAKNVTLQQELGAKIILLNKTQLQEKFPWMNLDGIENGSLGVEGEGWFDPWSLVIALKQKNISMGTKYIHGELIGFDLKTDGTSDQSTLDSATIRMAGGEEAELKFSIVVNCCGAWAAEVAEMANIGIGSGVLSIPLPVEPRKRFVFVTHCPSGPVKTCPFVIDPSGVYFRREGMGGNFICGSSPPTEADEPSVSNLDVDYNFYDETVWPTLAKRAPCFNDSKLKSAWAGYYDYNAFDQNLVIGPHPTLKNFYFANGLSGHGLQHSIGVGRAVMELLVYGSYKTINLEKFHFDRFVTKTAVYEEGII